MIVQTLISIKEDESPHPAITAEPLTREAFAPFGTAVCNPAPDRLPHNTAPSAIAAGELTCGAKSANQGSAIQYRDLCEVQNLYHLAASSLSSAATISSSNNSKAVVATPRLTMFVSGARELQQRQPGGNEKEEEEGDGSGSSSGGGGKGGRGGFFEVKILERHPFTTQTFCPLGVDPHGPRRYLVIVAPSIPPQGTTTADDSAFLPPPPSSDGDGDGDALKRGYPDLAGMRAFVATGDQAVTYGAGTWHAPMVVLGPAGSAVDFVVTQFANGVDVEDCQEVVLKAEKKKKSNSDDNNDSSGVWVRVPADDDDDYDDSKSPSIFSRL